MSNSQQFPNIPQATWTCWQTNLVPYAESQGASSVQFSGGNSGSISFHHPVLFSNGHFAFTYSYDPSAQVLTLTIDDSPNELPAALIFDFVRPKIYTCPPQ